ncbi:MAG: hypothetical protein L6R40_002459 [Gallowayella cf. fulva]|nr:MAG: hypothetical protein L6R40_002459 [Xanthomendoza cf. fulva]
MLPTPGLLSWSVLSVFVFTSQAATVFNGEGTFYSPSVGFGSCGNQNSDSDLVAALAQTTMRLYNPSNPNNNPLCGHKVKVWETSKPSNTVTVALMDTCPGCHGSFDLDLSPAAFNKLDNPDVGRIKISWEFVDPVTLKTGPFAGAGPVPPPAKDRCAGCEHKMAMESEATQSRDEL